MGEFALLREGRAWYEPRSRTLISLSHIAACPLGTAALTLYNDTATGFYGYRSDSPGQERWGTANFTGYASLECAQLHVTSAAAPPRGKLEVEIQPALQVDWVAVRVTWPAAQQGLSFTISAVWKDQGNKTFAHHTLKGANAAGYVEVGLPCSTCSAHFLAGDGRHTMAQIQVQKGGDLSINYIYFEQDNMSRRSETFAAAFAGPMQQLEPGLLAGIAVILFCIISLITAVLYLLCTNVL